MPVLINDVEIIPTEPADDPAEATEAPPPPHAASAPLSTPDLEDVIRHREERMLRRFAH